MSSIYIRSMLESDIEAVSQLADRYYPPELYEDLDALIMKFNAYRAGCYVAVDGPAVVGYIFSHPWDTRPVNLNDHKFSLPVQPICYYIHDMLVDPEYRRRSLGRSMAEIVMSHAILDGFSRIDLVAINDRAQKFWKHMGFQHVGASKHGVFMSRGFGPRKAKRTAEVSYQPIVVPPTIAADVRQFGKS